jgi:hypothetical protein
MSKAFVVPKLPTLADIYDMEGIKVEWAIEKLIPKEAITILHGAAGVGKTWVGLKMACCISDGIPFVGLPVSKMNTYYIDFENPLPLLNERAKVLGKSSSFIWHMSNPSMAPPRLDSNEWETYKKLPAPGLLVVDTLRASNFLEENNSRHISFLMARLKTLRDKHGFTVVVIHHSRKDSNIYKGSTAIIDLCDCELSLSRVENGGKREDDGGESGNATLLQLATTGKTRYEPFSLYLRFDATKGGFERADDPPDPDENSLKIIHDFIVRFAKEKKKRPNQTDIASMMNDHGMNKKRLLRLLKKGEGVFFKVISAPHVKAKLYEAITPNGLN